MSYIVELEPGQCYAATWSGDPGRTCVQSSAKRYDTRLSAARSLAHARRFSPFTEARVVWVPTKPAPKRSREKLDRKAAGGR
jgi:hypothetical protein